MLCKIIDVIVEETVVKNVVVFWYGDIFPIYFDYEEDTYFQEETFKDAEFFIEWLHNKDCVWSDIRDHIKNLNSNMKNIDSEKAQLAVKTGLTKFKENETKDPKIKLLQGEKLKLYVKNQLQSFFEHIIERSVSKKGSRSAGAGFKP